MKVVKPGREQKGWAREFDCTGKGNKGGGCGATLLVEQADVYQTHHYDYGGGHDVFNTFRCPCGVQTDIDVSLPFTPRENETAPAPSTPPVPVCLTCGGKREVPRPEYGMTMVGPCPACGGRDTP